MGGSIADWPALLHQAYEHLCPGGWIELSDFDAWASTDDDSLPATSSYHEFQVSLNEAARKFGRVMNVGPLHKQNLVEAGFVDVVDDRRKVSGLLVVVTIFILSSVIAGCEYLSSCTPLTLLVRSRYPPGRPIPNSKKSAAICKCKY